MKNTPCAQCFFLGKLLLKNCIWDGHVCIPQIPSLLKTSCDGRLSMFDFLPQYTCATYLGTQRITCITNHLYNYFEKISVNQLMELKIPQDMSFISNYHFQISVTESTPVVEENVKDKTLPKALVKPQMLTHLIEGNIIQEGKCEYSLFETCSKLLSMDSIFIYLFGIIITVISYVLNGYSRYAISRVQVFTYARFNAVC